MKKRANLILPSLAVFAVLGLAGIGCTKTEEPLPEGQVTADVDSATLPTDGSESSTAADEPFVVDLVPGDDAPIEEGDQAAAADDATDVSATDETASDAKDADDATEGTKKDEADLTDLVATPVETDDTKEKTDTKTEASDDKADADDLKELAETLAEVHGTFTNKDKVAYQNYKDLKPYTTSSMQAYLDGQTAGAEPAGANDPFFGRTTTALSAAVLTDKASSAKVLVTAKQEDISGSSAAPTTYFRLMRLEFAKEDGEWKLDGLYVLDPTEAQ